LDAVNIVFQKYFGDLLLSREVDFEVVAAELWELRRAL
jgi:hypothetical protein